MILIPNMEVTIFINGDNYCSVAGHPWQIANALFIEEVEIDDKTTLIRPTICKELSIYDNGDMACLLYQNFFEAHNININLISAVHPEDFFKEGLWND